jgi:hypothetical protein
MEKIRNIIMEAVSYKESPIRRSISASSLTRETIELWLRFKYGVPKREEFSRATVGSLMHLAMENIFNKYSEYEVEMELEKKMMIDELGDSWFLTGTLDLYDKENNIIYDWKTIKGYRVDKFLADPLEDDYTIQLNAYRYLLGKDSKMAMIVIDTNPSYDFSSGETDPMLRVVEVPKISDSRIERIFEEQVSKLVKYLKDNKIPPKCVDTYPRKSKGEIVELKCAMYCSYKDVCPRIKPQIRNKSIMKDW